MWRGGKLTAASAGIRPRRTWPALWGPGAASPSLCGNRRRPPRWALPTSACRRVGTRTTYSSCWRSCGRAIKMQSPCSGDGDNPATLGAAARTQSGKYRPAASMGTRQPLRLGRVGSSFHTSVCLTVRTQGYATGRGMLHPAFTIPAGSCLWTSGQCVWVVLRAEGNP